jgi:hypothetical protein
MPLAKLNPRRNKLSDEINDLPIVGEGNTPAPEYQEMPPSLLTGSEPDKKKIYNADETSSMREAAEEVTERRTAESSDDDPRRRAYMNLTSGEVLDPSLTVSPERAGDEIKIMRQAEHAAQVPWGDEIAATIDKVRADYAAATQPQPQVQQPPPEQVQPEQSHYSEQVQQPQQPDIDPEIRAALENPKVRAALEAEVSQVAQAANAYRTATWQAAQISAAALLSFAPELASVPTDQLPTAISAIAKTNPARAAQIQQHIAQTKALCDRSQQVAAHQQAQVHAAHQAQMRQWAQEQDKAFEAKGG